MNFRIIEVLGMGQNGPIFRVKSSTGSHYIIKEISTPSPILGQLFHPNIIQERYQIPCGTHWKSVLEDAFGIDLEQLIRHSTPAPYTQAIIKQTACGLMYAHKKS